MSRYVKFTIFLICWIPAVYVLVGLAAYPIWRHYCATNQGDVHCQSFAAFMVGAP